jgi:hypothetical protein
MRRALTGDTAQGREGQAPLCDPAGEPGVDLRGQLGGGVFLRAQRVRARRIRASATVRWFADLAGSLCDNPDRPSGSGILAVYRRGCSNCIVSARHQLADMGVWYYMVASKNPPTWSMLIEALAKLQISFNGALWSIRVEF